MLHPTSSLSRLALPASSPRPKPPGLVRQWVDEYSGGHYEYREPQHLEEGQTLYHGQFTRHIRYTGSNDAEEVVYYRPVDEKSLTTTTYGTGGDERGVLVF